LIWEGELATTAVRAREPIRDKTIVDRRGDGKIGKLRKKEEGMWKEKKRYG